MPNLVLDRSNVIIVISLFLSQGPIVAIELLTQLFVFFTLFEELLEAISFLFSKIIICHRQFIVIEARIQAHVVHFILLDLHTCHIVVKLLAKLVISFWGWANPSLLLEVLLSLPLVLALRSLLLSC